MLEYIQSTKKVNEMNAEVIARWIVDRAKENGDVQIAQWAHNIIRLLKK